jgi:hypothetical protein
MPQQSVADTALVVIAVAVLGAGDADRGFRVAAFIAWRRVQQH